MKKLLLIVGVVCGIVCVLSLLYAALNLFGYHHVLDGSAQLYSRLRQRTTVCFVVGAVFAATGAVCLIVRART